MSSLKIKTNKIIQDINQDQNKSFSTSFTIPLWNNRRLQYITKKLKSKNITISSTELAVQCITLLQKKLKRQKSHTKRTARKNSTTTKFEKVSIRFSEKEYNSLHAKKSHMKVSVSYMFDLAIRMYLSFVYKLFLQRRRQLSFGGKYHRNIKLSKSLYIKWIETFEFIIKIQTKPLFRQFT